MKERILISQDNELLKSICSDLNQFTPLLINLKKAYESLEIGEFSQTIYNEIIIIGTGKIAQRFVSSIELDIEKTGVIKSITKENIKKGADTILNEFLECVKGMKKFRPETYTREKWLTLNNISFSQKGFHISHDNKENILESQCRIYLNSEQDHNLYEDLTKFIESFEVIEKHMNEMGVRPSRTTDKISFIKTNFLKFVGDKFEVNPAVIPWANNRKQFVQTM